MKTEQKELVCEYLDAYREFAWKRGLTIEELKKFKQDKNLLPKNVRGWYIENETEWCVYYDFEKGIMYGIDYIGDWFKKRINEPLETPATQQQVEERLFPFFEKMGYKEKQAKCLASPFDCKLNLSKAYFTLNYSNEFYVRNNEFGELNCIMKDGILAEIIEEKENEMEKTIKVLDESIRTLEEIKKELKDGKN